MFAPFTLNSTSLNNDFMVKYDAAGNVKWADCMATSGTNCSAGGYAVCTDSNNNIYETGTYEGTAKLGTLSISSTDNTSMFIAKYNAGGTPIWLNSASLTSRYSYAFGTSVTCDRKSNVIVTGTFRDTISFGTTTLLSAFSNSFLVKYDSNGNLLWAKAIINDITSPGNCSASTVATDLFNNIYATGQFTGTVYLANDTLTAASVSGPSLYLAKYDPNGKLIWAEAFGAVTNDGVTPVIVDKSNNVYLGGQFINSTPFIIGSYSLNDPYYGSGSNSFLARLTPNGNVMWAIEANPVSPEEMSVIWIESLAIDNCNNVYWAGISSDSISIGSYKGAIPASIPHIDSTHFNFVVKLDSMGNAISGTVFPDNDKVANNIPYAGVAIDYNNNISFCGQLNTTSMVLGKTTLTGPNQAYITKFTLPGGNCCSGLQINVSGNDTICKGESITATGVGGTTYLWSTGATTSAITLTPAADTVYNLTLSSGACSVQDTIPVSVKATFNITACCDTTIQPGQSVQLNASGGGTYLWTPANGLSCTTCSNPNASPLSTTTYTLSITSDSGCHASQTITIDVNCGTVFIPDAFSPNGDGQNDVLYVRGDCIKTLDFNIYDRWGNKVFESTDKTIGWDGTCKGHAMNTGTYAYYFSASMFDGSITKGHGNVALVR